MSQQTLIPYESLTAKGIVASKVTLWRWERANRFPQRIAISHQKVAWLESEVDRWLSGPPRST
jgi:predicted DNA-binding transcriptional regulator AlpA